MPGRYLSLRRRMRWELVNYAKPYGCREVLDATLHVDSLGDRALETAYDILELMLEVGDEYYSLGPPVDVAEIYLLRRVIRTAADARNRLADGSVVLQ